MRGSARGGLIGIGLAAVAAAMATAQRLPLVRPRAGMVITASVRFAPGRYLLPAPAGDSAAIIVRGNHIVVDLTGVTLRGTPDVTDADQRVGTAILVDGGRWITIKGARVRGYQTGIRAVGTSDLALLDNDLSDNWRPRLFSEIGHESLVDWLSFHHNENAEWRRFGAGIALEGVRRGALRGNTVHRGMNGLMLTRTDSVQVEQNDVSFNSGVGIGLYRSTANVIQRNRVDYNVRGFSRYYRRGQDSADLLMFEQASNNEVIGNSMTHGGDGLFLWAGQSTMDTGEGGSNDNLFIGNDFSYAPTNAMEATFSRNRFILNRVVGSDHGLWGGYSYASLIVGNCFERNRIGIAVEHGQDDSVLSNAFLGDSTAIALWADPVAPSDWGYPKTRDTRSRDWLLEDSSFERNRVGLRVRQTDHLASHEDGFTTVDTVAVMADTMGIAFTPVLILPDPRFPTTTCARALEPIIRQYTSTQPDSVPSTPLSLRDRSAIVIDDWGPYDWTTPKLWPIDSTPNAPLQVLGPSGRWRVVRHPGLIGVSRDRGISGDTITLTPAPGRAGDWRLDLTDSAGRRFSFDHFDPIPGWDIDYLPAPHGNVEWNAAPLLSRQEPRLDKMAYGPPFQGVPATNWGLTAATEVDLAPGTYTLRAISDDGIRVWVDGQVLIDRWAPHESLVDAVRLGAGHHGIMVQYRQLDGWMELRVEIVRGWVPSAGSPGPH